MAQTSEIYGAELYQETPTTTTATPSVNLGSRMLYNGKTYVYCYITTATDKRLFVSPVTAGSGYSVTVTTVSGSMRPVIGNANEGTIAASTYGWIMTRGYGKYVSGGVVTMAVGGALAPCRLIAGDDGVADFATGATGTTGITIGYLTTAITDTTGTSTPCFVNTGF
jgi:hypothetical protein